MHSLPLDSPAVVLDTNVVIDWLVFADPRLGALADRIESRLWRWLASERMRDELADVLLRPPFKARQVHREQVLTSFDRLASLVAIDAAPVSPCDLQCLDPDDQMFIDLAVAQKARWLFTRDKALLALSSAARRHGLEIVAPRRGQPEGSRAP